MRKNTSPRKVVNLRIDPELYDRLHAFARRTERSANATAVLAIREFLDRNDQPAPTDQIHTR